MYRVIVWEGEQFGELVLVDTFTTTSTIEELLYHFSLHGKTKLANVRRDIVTNMAKGTVLEDNSKYDLHGYSFIDGNKRCTHVWIR